MSDRDDITTAIMAQQEPAIEPLPMAEPLASEGVAEENVAPLYAMRRPRGSGILAGQEVNAFPVMPSTFQASAGTEDFDRMYQKASGGSGGPDYSKLMMMMGGG